MIHSSRWSKFFGALPVVLALAGLAGCEKPSAADDDSDVAAAEQGVDAPAKHEKGDKMRGHGRGHGGPAMLLGAALHELDLTDAQKATIKGELDALHDAREDRAAAKDDHEASRAALAAAVRSGKIDESAQLAQNAPPKPDMARIAKAIGVLHDTLTAAQRKQLVASVQERMESFGGPDGEHHKGMRGGKDARDDNARDGAREKGKGMRMHGPMGHMLKNLSLTEAQQAKVNEALAKLAPSDADREAMKANHEAFRKTMNERLQSFAADSFDAKAFVAMPEGAAKFGPDKMHGHMVKELAAIVPLLDDAQRAELAKRIEQGPPAHFKGKGRMHDQAE